MTNKSRKVDRIESSDREIVASSLTSVKNTNTTYAMVNTGIENHDIEIGVTVVYEQIDGVSITIDTNIGSNAARQVIVAAMVDILTDVFGTQITNDLYMKWEGTGLLLFIPEQAWV